MSPSSLLNLKTATSCNDMSSSSPSPLNRSYLPDDLLLNCFARVSRLYYPTLSLVSKRFRSLIASLELRKTRTLLNRKESCLYVCLRFYTGEPPRWFTLSLRPTHLSPNPNPKFQWFTPSPCFRPLFRKKESKSSDNVLLSVPSPNLPSYHPQALATIGSNIYMICDCGFSSRFLFMDCRSHTWHEAPRMKTARKLPDVDVLDGKLYVVGSYIKCDDDSNLVEVFDPKTQTWEHVPGTRAEIRGTVVFKSLVIKGKLYLVGDEVVVYNPKENRWDAVGYETRVAISGLEMVLDGKSSCVIDEVTYCYRTRKQELEWYDYEEESSWNVVKGLEGMRKSPSNFNDRSGLVNYGGKLGVLWLEDAGCFSFKTKVWCAVIALERRSKREIYGKVEWCDVVLTVPKSCLLAKVVAATV